MEGNEQNLAEVFIKTHRLMHRYNMIQHNKNLGELDPRRGQGRILAALKHMSGINQRELAFVLDIRPQSLGELLQKLESNGYVVRKPSEEDKRSLIVSLTDKGKNLQFRRPSYDDLFSCLDESEQVKFQKLLNRVAERLLTLIKAVEQG